MWNISPAGTMAERLAALAVTMIDDHRGAKADSAERAILGAIAAREPATLGAIVTVLGRGAPALSRAIDTLVRAGQVERSNDPDNRRRLALRLTAGGRARLDEKPRANAALTTRLGRLAQSELRAIERAVEILERMPG